MNKVNININKQKKTIGVDLIGSINNIKPIIQTISNKIKSLDLSNWKLNIFTKHAKVYWKEEQHLLEIIKHCDQFNAKQLDIIVAKPQKCLKENIANLVKQNNIKVKLLTSNKIN